MKSAGIALRTVLDAVAAAVRPGINTFELERIARSKIRELGVKPAFYRYRNYPCYLCTSINEEIVHGIPREGKRLREGDIISIDCGVRVDGYYSDAAVTLPVGEVEPRIQRLIDVTREALEKGISEARVGNRVGHISFAIQQHVQQHGFYVIKDFVGHGIGKQLHEEPQVPNYGVPEEGHLLTEGMVLAIEPMVSMGTSLSRVLEDGWTAVTADRSCSAHFEDCVAITTSGPLVLTKGFN